MIRYAITAGKHRLFLNRNPNAPRSSLPRRALASPEARPHTAEPDLLLDQVRTLAQMGVDYLQLREKHLDAGQLASLARQILAVLHEQTPANLGKTRLLINTRADVAAATGACGVHLPAAPGGLVPNEVRNLYRSIGLPPPTISISCHTLPELRRAHTYTPDLILFSPVFGKWSESALIAPAAGLQALKEACAIAHPIPVLALGGVSPADIPACLQAGAAGVAGIRLFEVPSLPTSQA